MSPQRNTRLPVPCQLASAASILPAGPSWEFEPKYDGYRCQVALGNTGARLYTRSELDWSERLAAAAPRFIPSSTHGTLIDSEVCVFDAEGRPDFSLLCQALASGARKLSFFAFDLLIHKGRLVTDKPLSERKAKLSAVEEALATEHFTYFGHARDGERLLEEMKARSWEGVTAKDLQAPYQPGARGPCWKS